MWCMFTVNETNTELSPPSSFLLPTIRDSSRTQCIFTHSSICRICLDYLILNIHQTNLPHSLFLIPYSRYLLYLAGTLHQHHTQGVHHNIHPIDENNSHQSPVGGCYRATWALRDMPREVMQGASSTCAAHHLPTDTHDARNDRSLRLRDTYDGSGQ